MTKIWHGLLEGWWMFFDTFWALVLGFVLSGIVQAFISRNKMEKSLGRRDARAIGRASLFGIISSSCSYAASALSRSIFLKGADFTTSIVFMFASTNLVIELGIVLWLLLGWQFALAQFVGGAVMILLLAVILPRFIPAKLVQDVRDLNSRDENSISGMESEHSPSTSQKLRASAGYTIGDFIMLRKELIFGFAISGLAMTLVPLSFWNSLFISGNGIWSMIENAVLGPFLAFISFVCSVGNVPLAAALWNSGITFGGVISFIFADLLALPLVLIYVKYYGRALAIRLSLLFWLVMSVSGLVTELIFQALSLIPDQRQHSMGRTHFGSNFTTYMNLLALIVVTFVFWTYKKGPAGEDSEFAQDPICGMQVRKADAPASVEYEGQMYYFCMDGCKEGFLKEKATQSR